ncbi:hypothetical protein ACLI4U_05700 [Natrialbaceae archaeon A-CW2]|uniref:hypothetical protein n=1 Tax=Natronosalvus amylolyticus TaxID=2961994 RepID=UPI0020C99D4B|nr:hypothetical protein [Natronosalvus amylolyticus]
MSDETTHGRDVELATEAADEEPEQAELPDGVDDAELSEAQQAARERADEKRRKEDIEHGSTERESAALENANPNDHRDEPPNNS